MRREILRDLFYQKCYMDQKKNYFIINEKKNTHNASKMRSLEKPEVDMGILAIYIYYDLSKSLNRGNEL